MKKLLSVALFLALASALPFVWRAHAQVGIGGAPAPAFATSLAQCPTVPTGYFLCVVVPGGTTQPFLALSVAGFNGGAPFAIQTAGIQGPAGPAGPPGPQGPPGPVQSFNTNNCTQWTGGTTGVKMTGCIQSTP
jgi:hypothetical protein